VNRSGVRDGQRLVLLVLAFVLALTGGSAQRAMAETPPNSPLYWSGPILVDPGTWPTGVLSDLSCASTSLCVALDGANNVVTTTDPAAGNDWMVTHLEGAGDGEGSGLSCISAPLCVAVTGRGSITTSTDPTGGASAWTPAALDGGNLIDGVSCVPGTLCVAVDDHGNVLGSTDPTGGAGAWTSANVDGEHALSGVSCVSTSLCVAVDDHGNVLTSTDPTGGAGTWSVTDVAGTAALTHVSCVPGLCVVAGGGGILASTDPTGGAGAWVSASGGNGGGGVSCASASLCVAIPAGTNGGLWASSNPTGGPGAWVAGEGPDGGRSLGSVSCAPTSFCVIGDLVGNVAIGMQTHVISVSLSGAGLGTVTSTPIKCPFINCSHAVPGVIEPQPIIGVACADTFGLAYGPWGTCSLEYPAGNEVTLTATPSSGSIFTRWGGACSGSASCTVTMSSDRSVTATFDTSTAQSTTTQTSSTPPRLTGIHESVKRWREGSALAHVSANKKLPVGTTFSFNLNESASMAFTFTKSASGHKIGRTCVAQTKKKKERGCTRTIAAGTLMLSAHTGLNRVSFDGLISKHKKLSPGSYTLHIVATASGQHSTPSTLHFTIANG
jgi:hypothetical protein